LRDQAEQIFKSGIVPEGIKSAEALMVIGLKGVSLGIPLARAMSEIDVIYNKARPSTKLQLEMAVKNIPGFAYDILDMTDQKCTLEFRRAGRAPFRFTYTREEADKSGCSMQEGKVLDDKLKRKVSLNPPRFEIKDNWAKQPKKMLFYRTASEGLSYFAPDYNEKSYTIDLDSMPFRKEVEQLRAVSPPSNDQPALTGIPQASTAQIKSDNSEGSFEEMSFAPPDETAEDILPNALLECSECHSPISQKVSEFSLQKFGRALCYQHQQNKTGE
jgi:hypothetical protein